MALTAYWMQSVRTPGHGSAADAHFAVADGGNPLDADDVVVTPRDMLSHSSSGMLDVCCDVDLPIRLGWGGRGRGSIVQSTSDASRDNLGLSELQRPSGRAAVP